MFDKIFKKKESIELINTHESDAAFRNWWLKWKNYQ